MAKKTKKRKKWRKWWHAVVRNIASFVLHPFIVLKYHAKIDKFKEQGDRQYLIISNHQTAFDQFMLGSSFRGAIYYLASEDIFSKGFISKLLKFLVAPIPIKKSTTDVSAVMNCIRVAREGGTIAIFPEGNRTFSGETGYIKEAIPALAKALKLPLVIYRIEGGYGVQPRWSDVTRGGKIHCYVKEVIEPERLSELSNEELYQVICDGLYVNEGCDSGLFPSKRSAEYIERAMYYCNDCGISEFESHGDTVECKRCGKKIKYLDNKRLVGVGFDFPYSYVVDWYRAQSDYVLSCELDKDKMICSDEAKFFEVIPYKHKKIIDKSATISLYPDKYVIGELVLPFSDISSVGVLGRNKLDIYVDKTIYQIKSHKRFCALKYMNIYYKWQAEQEKASSVDGKKAFLGM